MCALIEDRWILLSASAYNLLWHIVLVDVFKENLASHRSIWGKGGSQSLQSSWKVLGTSMGSQPHFENQCSWSQRLLFALRSPLAYSLQKEEWSHQLLKTLSSASSIPVKHLLFNLEKKLRPWAQINVPRLFPNPWKKWSNLMEKTNCRVPWKPQGNTYRQEK